MELCQASRARRDADLTSALIAEEYKVHSLLSGVSAPRVDYLVSKLTCQ